MLGHLTTLIPAHAARVVVIGCGAGVTAGAVSVDPAVTRETIAEIEPLVPRVVSQYFSDYNFNVVNNPKVTVHLDDARHYLLTTKEKFDAITSDSLDPWVRGAATLYMREFFEFAKFFVAFFRFFERRFLGFFEFFPAEFERRFLAFLQRQSLFFGFFFYRT